MSFSNHIELSKTTYDNGFELVMFQNKKYRNG